MLLFYVLLNKYFLFIYVFSVIIHLTQKHAFNIFVTNIVFTNIKKIKLNIIYSLSNYAVWTPIFKKNFFFGFFVNNILWK